MRVNLIKFEDDRFGFRPCHDIFRDTNQTVYTANNRIYEPKPIWCLTHPPLSVCGGGAVHDDTSPYLCCAFVWSVYLGYLSFDGFKMNEWYEGVVYSLRMGSPTTLYSISPHSFTINGLAVELKQVRAIVRSAFWNNNQICLKKTEFYKSTEPQTIEN